MGTSSASLLRQTPFQCSMQFPLPAGRNRNTFVFCPNIFGVVLFPFLDGVLIDLLSVATWYWRGPLLAPRECASWPSPLTIKRLPTDVFRLQPFPRPGRLAYISLAFPPYTAAWKFTQDSHSVGELLPGVQGLWSMFAVFSMLKVCIPLYPVCLFIVSMRQSEWDSGGMLDPCKGSMDCHVSTPMMWTQKKVAFWCFLSIKRTTSLKNVTLPSADSMCTVSHFF